MVISISPVFLILIILLSILILIVICSIIECNSYIFKFYNIHSDKLKDHKRIVYISDFHDKSTYDLSKLVFDISNLKSDIILLGGDFVEYSMFSSLFNDLKYENTKKFINLLNNSFSLTKKEDYNFSRIFFSYGNHELRLKKKNIDKYNAFNKFLSDSNIRIIDNESVNITDNIYVTGFSLRDGYYGKLNLKKHIDDSDVKNIVIDTNNFNIALFHKPDYIEDLIDMGLDLVLSGHNHGGLLKLPYDKALLSPDLKFLPKYNYGLYSFKEKHAIVSSGIGEHFIKVRVNNRPEIVVIDIN